MLIRRILLDPQGGEGNGAGDGTPPPNQATAPADAKGADLNALADKLAREHGNTTMALMHVLNEGHKGREKNREALARIKELEGEVAKAAESSKPLAKYRELGDPADIVRALAERDQYKAEAEGFRKAETVRSAAEVVGYRPAVLATLARDLVIEVAEEKGKDGKAVKVARVKGEGDESTPLIDYAAANWADFLPSLKAEAEKSRPLGTPSFARPPAPAGAGSSPQHAAPAARRNGF